MSQTSGSTTHVFTRDTRGNVLAAKQGSNRLYYVQDATDSVIGVFDAAGGFTGGYSYSPYGELRAARDNPVIRDNPLRFSSGPWDAAANLYRLGARYYDPSLGRFTQYDPTGQEPNPYSYAAGNPANFVDPTGTKAKWGWFTKAVDEVGKGLDGFQAFQTVRAHARRLWPSAGSSVASAPGSPPAPPEGPGWPPLVVA
ncbi:RHS repeat-associated core domain-containing protein [Cellulomonas sp.]|uniref:RHS repeat-associated core domain-containing protein n=1 Tax=Cellulomonas sp. TaxID=40001 RepID=UPI0028117839|nr:RHS repeat-associated core domain-containing protein [Cellulomonas sp.]